MRPLIAPLLCLSLALPAAAQDTAPEGDGFADSFSDSARDFFNGFMDDAEPALREIGPMLRQLAAMIGDVANYQMPEKLPNGDIIIRRRTPQQVNPGDDVPDAVPGLPDPPPGQSIDL